MKSFIYVLAGILISGSSLAQKCKEVVDPITSEKKYEFVRSSDPTSTASYGNFRYEIVKGEATLTKDFYYTGAINSVAKAGSIVYFKLEDGEILALKTVKDAAPKINGGGYNQIVTVYTFILSLSKSDLTKLALSDVILIRIPKVSEEGYYDLDKKHIMVRKSKNDLKKGAACMSAYL